MNPTKNISYIEVEQGLFEQLCESRYDEKIYEIQEGYFELKREVEEKITRWMKLKEIDCYLETKNKILFPDTRKLGMVDFTEGGHASAHSYYSRLFAGVDSYSEVLFNLKNLDEEDLEMIRKNVEEKYGELPTDFDSQLAGFEACALTGQEARNLFDDRSCPCLISDNMLELKDKKCCGNIIIGFALNSIYKIGNVSFTGCKSVDAAVKISIHKFPDAETPFEIIVKNGLYPEEFDDRLNERIKEFHQFLTEVLTEEIDITNFAQMKEFLKNKKIESVFGSDLRSEAIEIDVEKEVDLFAESDTGDRLRKYYENCDYIRARIQKYNSKWFLSDEGRGHWELWSEPRKPDAEQDEKGASGDLPPKHILHLKHGVIARNPIIDVKHDAVVGIDFGTKSTIVALQDGNDPIIPLRVGMADYSVAPEAKHFENPTVMQFVDLNHFLLQYQKSEGRPMTAWDDLMISHEAFAHLITSQNSIELASFVTDLKQWAAGKYGNKHGGHLIIKDAAGCRYDMNHYMKITEEDIDLIELYAYYIGLFINNMHTGVYLDYILSFPETFSVEIKCKILKSFQKGIKKSIPSVVLEDQTCKEEFRVRQGSGEPAAYAVCALEQYGIEPTDEGVFYGIFDFGGGTTDYDYGIWKNAPEEEESYNYIIRHYGSGGDKTLGGENILQLLAYEVFSEDTGVKNADSNRELMRKKKLVYYRPDEGNVYSGTEALNNDSESALLNTKLLMEALRPIWEESAEITSADLSLFSEEGREDVTLHIDMDMVNRVIDDRIESGVRNFFEGLRQAFEKREEKPDSRIHLFLAGNSSKSERVLKLFCEYADRYDKLIFPEKKSELSEPEENADRDSDTAAENHFIIYPPLGTKEAEKIRRDKGITAEEDGIDMMAPTGKTGVAFGLLMCREGSTIKVESEIKQSEQIKLNYYIGINYRKNFKLKFDRSAEYNKWLKFSKIAAGTETFEFYYSQLPEVTGGTIAIRNNKSIYRRKCLVDNVISDACVYFRFINPTQLEYVVALEDKIEAQEYMSKLYLVNL